MILLTATVAPAILVAKVFAEVAAGNTVCFPLVVTAVEEAVLVAGTVAMVEL